MYQVEQLIATHGETLKLKKVAAAKDLRRAITLPQVHRPGLSLAGFLKNFVFERPLVFGEREILYLEELSSNERHARLKAVFSAQTPFVVVADGIKVPRDLTAICRAEHIPLFSSPLPGVELLALINGALAEAFAPATTCHGTFIEAYGVGVLIQGDSSVGKSEAALGLIERGHRLVSDDVVKLRLRKDNILEGCGEELTRHMMEIRGIGIINVAHLYGAVCVRDAKSLDVIVKLEEWNDGAFYDRVGLDERFTNLLGVDVSSHVLPVKPGRDVVLLIETIILNHRLKLMGYHSAREFNVKLLETIAKKQRGAANSV